LPAAEEGFHEANSQQPSPIVGNKKERTYAWHLVLLDQGISLFINRECDQNICWLQWGVVLQIVTRLVDFA
jgi:hypothetical protein